VRVYVLVFVLVSGFAIAELPGKDQSDASRAEVIAFEAVVVSRTVEPMFDGEPAHMRLRLPDDSVVDVYVPGCEPGPCVLDALYALEGASPGVRIGVKGERDSSGAIRVFDADAHYIHLLVR
jgi:hypothetical protein